MRKALALLLVLCMALTMTAAFAEEPVINYTYQDYLQSSPTTWNPHTQETDDDSYISDWNTMGLYGFDFNLDHPEYGYVVDCEMASALPEDVTAQYAGDANWNVPADATEGYVYKLALNEKACWQDGTPINADSYIYSMQQLLNPKMQNYRADSYYVGSLVMTNAKNYVYQGQTAPSTVAEYMAIEGTEDLDAFVAAHASAPAYVNWNYSFGDTYDYAAGAWTGAAEDAQVLSGGNLEQMLATFIEAVTGWGYDEAKAREFFMAEAALDYTYPELAWDKVGLQKSGDYELTMFLDKPLTGFYLYYNLGGNWLVYEPLYEANKQQVEGSDLITSTYGTSLETTMGYGPYKLAEFQDDKVIKLVRNDKWYGYTDGNHEGQFMTDAIVATIVKEPATRLQMFLKGQIDVYALSSDQVADYRASDYIYYTLTDFTGNLFIQANAEALKAREEEGINKTILTLKDFRKALAWSIDRADFAASTTSSSSAGFGLLNSRYIADVDEVIPYRSYDQAKAVLCEVYGLEYGEGKDYASLEEAYDAITGYDLDGAKKLFDAAYDQAIADGLMKDTDIVRMVYSAGEDSEATRKTYNYLNTAWTSAVVGTKLEGKLEITFDGTAGNDFAKNFKNGLSDLLIAGWTGADWDPFYFMLAYLNESYRYANSFDPTQSITLTVNGEELTMTCEEWYTAMMGDDPAHPFGVADVDISVRLDILAALEGAVLEDYTSSPLTYGSSATLRSMKINYFIEEYNELLGRGGITYITYNFTDAEWEAYVAEQGGELNYK